MHYNTFKILLVVATAKKKKKKNKGQTDKNDANLSDVNVNNASAAPATLVSSKCSYHADCPFLTYEGVCS